MQSCLLVCFRKTVQNTVNVPVLNQHHLVYIWELELVPICTPSSVELTLGNLVCMQDNSFMLLSMLVCVFAVYGYHEDA